MQIRWWRSPGFPRVVSVLVFCSASMVSLEAQESSGVAELTPLRPEGVTPQIEKAIERGLEFLAENQQADGSYGKSSREQPGWQTYPTAITALVGLTFFSSGSTPSRGPYAENLQKITEYLLTKCSGTRLHRVPGLLYNPMEDEARPMYCHAFGMTYLALVFGQEKDPKRREKIRTVLKKAIELSDRSQTSHGGWGYTPNRWEDEGTLVVTFLQALRTCRDVGIVVPKKIIDSAVSYIEKSANADGSVRYRVTSRRSNTRPGVTSASVVALWQAGKYDSELLKRISNYVSRYVAPTWVHRWNTGHHGEYVMYYLSQSQHMLGGKVWQRFYEEVSGILLREQDRYGRWDGRDGGDFYGTAIALLILQLPYNRLSVYQR